MPQQHSAHFFNLTSNLDQQLDANKLSIALDNSAINYEEITDLLREINDAQFGIVSTFNQEKNEWLRDATKAFPLENRISHNSPRIEANNSLLRCLARLRPIEFAIKKKLGDDETKTTVQQRIRENFVELSHAILAIEKTNNSDDKQKVVEIKKLEQTFNTFLIKELHEANLTKGCDNEKKAKKLLFNYRNLSSVLTPARTLVTLVYDKENQILHRETQYPVTKKTNQQKQTLEQLKPINPYPISNEKNGHTISSEAHQEANSLFADLIADDHSLLPAQTRKSHLVGAKNAFLVKNEIIPIDEESVHRLHQINCQATDENTLWLARSASPVYVGKGENETTIQLHTRENIEQIRNKARELQLDKPSIQVITLNTYNYLQQQSTIIRHVKAATRNNKHCNDNFSYLPTNIDGTCRLIDLAPELNFEGLKKPEGISPFQKATRLKSVTTAILAANQTNQSLCLVHCASGQDRTGTAIEKTIQLWIKKRYLTLKKPVSTIEKFRAAGGNAAEITAHLVPGSRGKKKDSIANNLIGKEKTFEDDVTNEFYLNSADTNKKNEVNNVLFLTQPTKRAIDEFTMQYEEFFNELNKFNHSDPELTNLVRVNGINILKNINSITQKKPAQLTAKEISTLTYLLSTAHLNIVEPNNPSHQKHLANCASKIWGKQSKTWQRLGLGAMLLGCALLLITGILAAIPTAGASIGIAAGITAALSMGSLTVGAISFFHGREKGLAKSLTTFEHTISGCKV